MTISHTIQEPTDYTKTSFIEHKVEYDLTIEILDPCETTTIEAMTINNMQAEVDGSAAVQALAAPTDSVALANGDQSGTTYCGTKTITIQSVSPSTPDYSNFLSLTSPSDVSTLTA